MDDNARLALVNALLTTTSIGCAVAGRIAIAQKRVTRHRNLMIAATLSSAAFMAVFVVRFVRHGFEHFAGDGVWLVLHHFVLFSHEPLAVINIPLVVVALILGLRKSFEAHVEVARIAFPVWMYVAATGVTLYALLYLR